MPRQTCRDCNRTVVLAEVGGERRAYEPEVLQVTPATLTGEGGVRMGDTVLPARRLHAPLCAGYVEQGRKDRIAREQRAFNKKHRSHGL